MKKVNEFIYVGCNFKIGNYGEEYECILEEKKWRYVFSFFFLIFTIKSAKKTHPIFVTKGLGKGPIWRMLWQVQVTMEIDMCDTNAMKVTITPKEVRVSTAKVVRWY